MYKYWLLEGLLRVVVKSGENAQYSLEIVS